MYQNVLKLYKPIGKTPLEAIGLLRQQFPQYADCTLGYAGRLDPMAEGLLLILVDNENKKRKMYEKLPKKYLFELLLGVETDSYDGLGIVKQILTISPDWKVQLQQFLSTLPKQFDQPYPPYSSARVNGKPLFYWARTGQIDDITIPTKNVSIDEWHIQQTKDEKLEQIIPPLIRRIKMINGKFRQEEILSKWNEVLLRHGQATVGIARIELSCSSGLYIRSLCHEIGKQLKTGGIAYSITRTAVSDMSLDTAIRI